MVLVVAMALVAAACTSSPESAEADSTTTAAPTTLTTTTVAPTTTRKPAEALGVVRVIRPNWDSALVSSSIVMVLLEQAGYEVEEFETRRGIAPDYLYGRLAQGEADLTLDMWPSHLGWIEGGGPLGPVGDLVTVIDRPHQPAGGLQGFLVTKSWADENNITHLGQINEDPRLAAAIDSDGDGLGEIYGCPESWTCDEVTDVYIRVNEWDSLQQEIRGSYDVMFDEFFARLEEGLPAVAYVWTPTSYFADAEVGEKTMWLSVTNEAALRVGNYPDEPGPPSSIVLNDDGTPGYTDVPSTLCTQGPDGCQLGWVGSDVTAAANTEWLDANPTAHALLNAVELNHLEVSELFAELKKRELEDWEDQIEVSWDIAEAWVADNPDRVNAWLDAALAS